jgi:hypothetical protein
VLCWRTRVALPEWRSSLRWVVTTGVLAAVGCGPPDAQSRFRRIAKDAMIVSIARPPGAQFPAGIGTYPYMQKRDPQVFADFGSVITCMPPSPSRVRYKLIIPETLQQRHEFDVDLMSGKIRIGETWVCVPERLRDRMIADMLKAEASPRAKNPFGRPLSPPEK